LITLHTLTTEYQANPIGLETCVPRLSWKIKTDKKNALQSSYRIVCAASKNDLLNKSSLIWDSGIVKSDQSVHVEYSGIELKSGQRIWWQVKITTNTGEASEWSAPAFWEMGLLNKTDWKAKWIQPNLTENPETSNPSPLLRKKIEVSKELTKATVYVTCHGLYQLQLNGKKVGDQEFTPGWTSYHKRLQYQTFDITDQIKTGTNAIGAILGDGWYRGFMGWQGKKNLYGEKSALLCQIQLAFSDGSEQLIVSDKSWKASTGAILASEIYHGEIYDARLEKTGWDNPEYNDSDWAEVSEEDFGFQNLVVSCGSPVKVTKELKPIEKIITPKGETVLDFGQNMVGRIRFNLKGNSGEKITIYHAEVLDKEGNFYIANLRPARQKAEYIFKGDEVESYAPHFTFMGFRYIKIEGYTGEFKLEDFTGEVIHSDMEFTGDFECSDPLVNRLQQNIQWGLRGNFLDVPTDCPQRDERLGWTGDAQVFAPTACFNVNAAPFFSKWMKDLEADQREDGSVPWVAPNIILDGGGTGWSDGFGATGWADAAIIIPWTVYQSFGDKRILENQYQSMKAWEEYMIKEAGETYLFNTGFHFGDWLSFAEYSSYIYNAPDYGFAGAHTEKDLLATAYFYFSTQLMQQTARILGKTEDAEKYKTLLPRIKEAFKNEFITPNGRLLSNTQAAFAVALKFGVLPDELVESASRQLAKNVEYFQHLTTGFLGTPVLCHALSESGRSDLAYKLLFNTKYPSWLYAVTMGATTIWERWDGIKPDGSFQDVGMNSFNHYAYGAIGNWLYQKVAGIQSSSANPGYKEIIIKPEPSDKLKFAKATLNSMYGTIESGWKWENDTLKMKVIIPPNTSAKVYIPQKDNSYQLEDVGSGTYEFESKIN
jgi:alpha-L-rhamnosidase